jgi:hypothetical protein
MGFDKLTTKWEIKYRIYELGQSSRVDLSETRPPESI